MNFIFIFLKVSIIEVFSLDISRTGVLRAHLAPLFRESIPEIPISCSSPLSSLFHSQLCFLKKEKMLKKWDRAEIFGNRADKIHLQMDFLPNIFMNNPGGKPVVVDKHWERDPPPLDFYKWQCILAIGLPTILNFREKREKFREFSIWRESGADSHTEREEKKLILR